MPVLHLAFWLIGAPAMAAGAYLVWRALLQDTPRGKRRCPGCWYDMLGVPGLVCPECGRAAPDEYDLHRPRRSRPLALAGVGLVLAGYLAGMAPNVSRVGLTGIVPTTFLLLIPTPAEVESEEWLNADAGSLGGLVRPSIWFTILADRHAAGGMWDWQSRYLIRRDLHRVVFCREKWLAGEPLCIRVGPGWFASPGATRVVRVTPRIEGSLTAEITLPAVPTAAGFVPAAPGFGWRSVGRGDFPHTLVPVPEGTTEITFDVQVLELAGGAAAPRTVFSGSVTKPVRLVHDAAEMMEAVRSPVIDDLVRGGLQLTIAREPTGKPYIHGALQRAAPVPRPVITGLKVEFLLDGQVIAWGQVRPNAWRNEVSNGWVHGDMGRVADTLRTLPWRARVSGSISSAIRNFGGEKYWVGSFECPLAELLD